MYDTCLYYSFKLLTHISYIYKNSRKVDMTVFIMGTLEGGVVWNFGEDTTGAFSQGFY